MARSHRRKDFEESSLIDVTAETVEKGDDRVVVPALVFDGEDDEDYEWYGEEVEGPDRLDEALKEGLIEDPLYSVGMSNTISGPFYDLFHRSHTVPRKPERDGGKDNEKDGEVLVPRWCNPFGGEDSGGGKKVIPGDNVVVDEDGKKVLVIPRRMHCKWHVQLHKTAGGTQWVLVFHIKHGRIGHAQIEVLGGPDAKKFKGRRYNVKGKVRKIHKDNDKIVAIMEKDKKPQIVIYDVENNVGRIKRKLKSGWKIGGFSL